jgi:polyferredoxin
VKIVTARRTSQVFFFLLFLWFCVVASVGEKWWHLRGWPVNWLLQLDPLVALGTVLTTYTLYAGLLWALVTVVLTILLGRFFCSWVCPFGTLHHFVGFLASREGSVSEKAARNRYHRAQRVKYFVLVFLLGAATLDLIGHLIDSLGGSPGQPWLVWLILVLCLLLMLFLSLREIPAKKGGILHWTLFVVGMWILLGWFFSGHGLARASLQTGLLDPIALIHRSVTLVVLPLIDGPAHKLAVSQQYTHGAWFIGAVFLAGVLLNLRVPRFYCKFLCPLGALLGVLGRHALWRIGKNEAECIQCARCEAHCEGACEPTGKIRTSECVLCMNCLDMCSDDLIGYRTLPSEYGEIVSPDLTRRGFVVSLLSGVAAVPMMRLGGSLASDWSPLLIRPPGALKEGDFLKRCIKCGQCMRVCPTNVLHPASFQGGLEGFWTPILNFRVGTSGCQYNCSACGHICPTAAIRPISLDEKHGKNAFATFGPVRLGTAFVDRGRCLPWAMDKPCIVCQENCPVSPKAIFTREEYIPIKDGQFLVKVAWGQKIELDSGGLNPGAVATGDHFCRVIGKDEGLRYKILENTDRVLVLSAKHRRQDLPEKGNFVEILIRLKRPFVDPESCIGCGICEHECPVRGQRAIRVTAENESRDKRHRLLAPRGI